MVIKMNKKHFVFLLKTLIFFLVLGLLWQRISLVVQVYGTDKEDPDRRTCLFFTLPKDTVDCLFIGTSHVYCSYIPQRMYDQMGITSASLATSSQSYQNTYWLLKEALRQQHPEVVVLDIHSVTTAADQRVLDFRLHATSGISVMPDLSWNKINAFLDIRQAKVGWSENMTIYDAFGLLEYKGEYQRKHRSLTELVTLCIQPNREYQTFGFYPTTTVCPMEELIPYINTDQYMDFQTTQEYEYLERIYHLLQDQGIDLLLVRAPYHMPEFDDYHLTEQAFTWAAEKNIPVIDYFLLLEETGIDLNTDFRDADHLNYLGAVKATDYLAEYLVQQYALKDHRGEKKYTLWEEMEYDYARIEKEVRANVAEQ